MNRGQVERAVAAALPGMVEWRRWLHRHPCLSFDEGETARYLCGELERLGIACRGGVGKHGVVAKLRSGRPGPSLALRADMDALPVTERTGLDFASERPGRMHACGHDAHMAVLLGAAAALRERREEWAGDVTLLFQYAEETPPGGAAPMIEAGCLDGVERIYGMHVSDELPAGTIGVRAGACWAASDHFRARLLGGGGHGSRPNETQDTISAACCAVQLIHTISARRLSPQEPAVVGVCSIDGKSGYNVIPSCVEIGGTVRTYDEAVARRVSGLIEEALRGACGLYGARYEYEYLPGYPVLVNHERETGVVREAARRMGLPCVEVPVTQIAEDFACYLQRVPGCFFRVGVRNPALDAVYPLHHDRFTIDEDAMRVALSAFLSVIGVEGED